MEFLRNTVDSAEDVLNFFQILKMETHHLHLSVPRISLPEGDSPSDILYDSVWVFTSPLAERMNFPQFSSQSEMLYSEHRNSPKFSVFFLFYLVEMENVLPGAH